MGNGARNLARLVAGVTVLLAGCTPPRLRPAPPIVLKAPVRTVTVWPTVRVDSVPGSLIPPWPALPAEHLELWLVDLLDLDRPELGSWLESWQPIAGRLARPMPIEPAPQAGRPDALRLARAGAYVLRARRGAEAHVALVIASSIRVALTLDDNDCEVLCAEAKSGQPVRGAYVRLLYRTERIGRERVLTSSGVTDSEGRWHTSLVRDRFAPTTVATAIIARDNDHAIATERRTTDHAEWHHRLTLRARNPELHPGQTAELVGVLQTRAATRAQAEGKGRLVPWPQAALKLWLLDPAGGVAGTARARTDDVGVFTAAFELRKDAPPGSYTVLATMEPPPAPAAHRPVQAGPWRFDAFAVVAPQAAPFRLKLLLNRLIVGPDEPLEATVEARRADGSPIPGARVRFLSWGYPVELDGAASWVTGSMPVDPARVVALPTGAPLVLTTDANGRALARWRPSTSPGTGGHEAPDADLLCAVRAEATVPDLGSAERLAEFILLRRPPRVTLQAARTFVGPSDTIELGFQSSLVADEQARTEAVCTLSHEDPAGAAHLWEIVRAPVAWLVEQRLVVAVTKPGRYAFTVQADGASSQAIVWATEDGRDLLWSGSQAPVLIAERPWLRRGEPMQALVAAPGRTAPLALTFRFPESSRGQQVTWSTIPLRTGARGVSLKAGAGDGGALQARLVQIAAGDEHTGQMTLGIEPGGTSLDVQARLLWVRQGEWSGRGYRVSTRDPLNEPVRSVVHAELVRPTFEGIPPAAVRRHTVQWYPGKATDEAGDIEVQFPDSALGTAAGLLLEAIAADGRHGLGLTPTWSETRAPSATPPKPMTAQERFDALCSHGLDSPLAQWLAAGLLSRAPELAIELPRRLLATNSEDEAAALIRLAVAQPRVAAATLEAAITRGGSLAPAALSLNAGILPELLPTYERALRLDPSPLVRTAAARCLARALPQAQPALTHALARDTDPIVRAAAAAALGNGGEAAIPLLAGAARSDPAAPVRLAAIAALRQAGGAAAAAALLGLLDDANADVVTAALRALVETGYCGADKQLFHLLRSASSAARADAALLLARGDAPDLGEHLLHAIRRAPSGPLVAALRPLASSRAVQGAMLLWLAHEDPEVCLAAAECLASVRHAAASAALRRFVEPDTPPALADRAAAALIELRDQPALPKLLALMEAGRLSTPTRRSLIEAVRALDWQESAPALIAILWRGLAEPGRLRQTEERLLWLAALDAAAALGAGRGPQAESFPGQLPPASPYGSALGALRDRGLAEFLAELWHSPLPDDLRRQTVQPYARLRGIAAVPRLIELLDSPLLQGPAMRALAEFGPVEALADALRDRSPVRRAAAAAVLGTTKAPRVAEALTPLLRDADPFVRCEAAWALAALTRQPVAYADQLAEVRQAVP